MIKVFLCYNYYGDNMKVYIKQEEKNPILPRIIFVLVFFIVCIADFLWVCFDTRELFTKLVDHAIDLSAAIFFFALDLYFIYAFLKKPFGFKAVLKDKKPEYYLNEAIINMYFEICPAKNKRSTLLEDGYNVYTYKDYNLEIGKTYILRIKEFNWEPTSVEEIDGKNFEKELPVINEKIGLIGAIVVILAPLILSIVGIMLYPKYALTFGIVAIICLIALIYIYIKGKNV